MAHEHIYTCDNIHVMQDSEEIIEYDNMINNNQILNPRERCNFRLKFIRLDWVELLPEIYLFTGNDKRARHMKTIKCV